MASDIPHPQAFVHNFLEALDIICNIGQNKNTLGAAVRAASSSSASLAVAVNGISAASTKVDPLAGAVMFRVGGVSKYLRRK